MLLKKAQEDKAIMPKLLKLQPHYGEKLISAKIWANFRTAIVFGRGDQYGQYLFPRRSQDWTVLVFSKDERISKKIITNMKDFDCVISSWKLVSFSSIRTPFY